MSRSGAGKGYNIRVGWFSLAYVVLLLGAIYAFKHTLVGGAAAYLVAILPALPIIGIFAAMGRYLVEEQDEYIRTLMVRRTLWASGFALSLATVWGFLESFEVAGHVDAYYVAVVWFFGLGLGTIADKLTGASDGC